MNSAVRRAALRALMEGGNYRDAVETETVMGALDNIPDLPLSPMIRNKESYRKWRDSDRTDTNSR